MLHNNKDTTDMMYMACTASNQLSQSLSYGWEDVQAVSADLAKHMVVSLNRGTPAWIP